MRTRPSRRFTTVAFLVGLAAIASACGADDSADVDLGTDNDCVVWLHGKGGDGRAPSIDGDRVAVRPQGNGEAWGGREWSYFTPEAYAAALRGIESAVTEASCVRVVVDGFSNGGAMAAKLYCGGEDFDGTLVGVVVDDPVTDASADDCRPAPGVAVALYWTGKLPEWGPPGVDCDGDIDWTCEGGTVISIEEYAARLGVAWQQSVHTDHEWYRDAPEIDAWLS